MSSFDYYSRGGVIGRAEGVWDAYSYTPIIGNLKALGKIYRNTKNSDLTENWHNYTERAEKVS